MRPSNAIAKQDSYGRFFKMGVGKSTTAIHAQRILLKAALRIVVDGGPNLSITCWARKGNLPFQVVDERQVRASGSRM